MLIKNSTNPSQCEFRSAHDTLPCIYANRADSAIGWNYRIIATCCDCKLCADKHIPATEAEIKELYRRLSAKEFLFIWTDEYGRYAITADRHKYIHSIQLDMDTSGWDELQIFLAKYAKDLDSHPGHLYPLLNE